MNAVVSKAYFSIDGEWLSDFARTRVMEGAWENALTMLVDDVNMTHEQAIKILKGEANLTGTTEIGNQDSPGLTWKDLPKNGKIAKAMKKQLDYMYGKVFKYKDKYWKPYAHVQGWCQDDYDFACRTSTGKIVDEETRNGRGSFNKAMRSMYYANTPSQDLLVILGNEVEKVTDVLCEIVNMPPIWYTIPQNNPVEHLRSLRKAGKLRLEQRGATSDTVDPQPETSSTPTQTPLPEDDSVPLTDEENKAAASELTQQFLADLDKASSSADITRIEMEYEAKFNKLRQGSIPSSVWDARDEAYDKARANTEALMRLRVVEQAAKLGGWMKLQLSDEDHPTFEPASIKVPTNAFLNWALRGFRFEDFDKERPEWPFVCGSGWKMYGDDPYHTDWMIGAGIPLKDTYESRSEDGSETLAQRVRDASFSARQKIVSEWTGVDFTILARGEDSWFSGEIVHALPNESVPPGSIAIAPSAGPKYYQAMISANGENAVGRGLLICETGGQLAHLAIVGREQKCTVLMVKDARKKYRPGNRLFVDLKEMKITIHL